MENRNQAKRAEEGGGCYFKYHWQRSLSTIYQNRDPHKVKIHIVCMEWRVKVGSSQAAYRSPEAKLYFRLLYVEGGDQEGK